VNGEPIYPLYNLLINLGSLVLACGVTFLTARRVHNDRLSAIEKTLNRIEGALRNSGFRF
jgi:hypothetical protein